MSLIILCATARPPKAGLSEFVGSHIITAFNLRSIFHGATTAWKTQLDVTVNLGSIYAFPVQHRSHSEVTMKSLPCIFPA